MPDSTKYAPVISLIISFGHINHKARKAWSLGPGKDECIWYILQEVSGLGRW